MNLENLVNKKKKYNCDVYIERYDDKLLLYPLCKPIEKVLTITEKTIEKQHKFPFTSKVVTNKVHIYVEFKTSEGVACVTYQGMLNPILIELLKSKKAFFVNDCRIAKAPLFPAPRLDLMHGFRFKQEELLRKALTMDSSGLIGAPTRYGKCFAEDTKILMYSGESKKVQDIAVGDAVMGIDGSVRYVKNITKGIDALYSVYIKLPSGLHKVMSCNGEHPIIYATKNSIYEDTILHAPARDLCGYFDPENKLIYSTYYGKKDVQLNPSVIDLKSDGTVVRHKVQDAEHTSFLGVDTEVQLSNYPFIITPEGTNFFYGFCLEGDDGFCMLESGLITHNTTLIINTIRAYPTLSICVVAPGVDLVKQLYADITGERGISPLRDVKLICSGKGKKQAEPGGVTVCSVGCLNYVDKGSIDLVLADEPHALVTDDRLTLVDSFTKARRIGFGATLHGRFDGRDKLIEGLFGSVLVDKTYKEAVEEGAICPLTIIFLKIQITPSPCRDRESAYNKFLFRNKSIANIAADICHNVIPEAFQTMVFIKNEKQAEMLLDTIGRDSTLAMAKRMTSKEREECDRLMKENIIKRCLCTKIYVQGVTFSDVRVLINLEAGGNNTSAIQKPGRLAEIRPGKKCGIVIDLLFVPPNNDWDKYRGESWLALCRDSLARKTAYEEKGYDISIVDNMDKLKETFNKLI